MNDQTKNRIREEWENSNFVENIDMEVNVLSNDNPDDIADWWLSKIAELLKSQRDSLVEKIKELRHEIQQDEMSLGNEQWKEGHTKCLEEVLSLIKEDNN